MRLKFLIYFLYLYLPFYLPIKILFPSQIFFLQDIIVGLLVFFGFIYKGLKTTQKRHNRIDVLMLAFLLYSLIMVLFLSAAKGGVLLIIKHLHTHISGIFMYFLARHLLKKKDFEVILYIYMCSAIIIAVLFVYEWINVNVFGGSIFSWVTDYNTATGQGEQFLSKGSWGFYRPMGILGYSHSTGIYISGGMAILYGEYQKNLSRLYIPILIVLFIAVILTASRIAIMSMLIFFLVDGQTKNIGQIIKKYIKLLLFFVFIIIVVQQFVLNNEINQLIKLISSSFSGNDVNTPITKVFIDVFSRDIKQIKFIFNNYLLALFTGAGFPHYTQNPILNPIRTNDTYFLMWITQYGLIGSSLMLMCLIKMFRGLNRVLKSDQLYKENRFIIISAYRVLLIYMFSTIHSSAIQMYSIYFLFFFFLGLSSYFISNNDDL